ncbi:hypothetical protein R1sor_014481 [Riccia sorocarpa]|uniref:Uncharacterized protein n=1 Tax=Riccia sorocarpa TaxID=122646 RepID=A0ABD3H9I6_9MARC
MGDTTPQLLTTDLQNAADHWAGDHTVCRTLPWTRKCVLENWEAGRESTYVQSGETHLAVKSFLKKTITENKMRTTMWKAEIAKRVLN